MAKFKAGDKVRRVSGDPARYSGEVDGENTVTSVSPCGNYIRFNGHDSGTVASNFELVPPTASAQFDNLCKAVADAQITVGVAIGKREAAQAELDAFVEQSVKRAAEVA